MGRVARCCCRAIGIEVDGLPTSHIICHCDNCKRRTGSAFGISAYFEDDQIVCYMGQARIYEKSSRFGDQKRYFCSLCGTTLYWTLGARAGYTGIAGGCFTDDPLPEPTRTVCQGDPAYEWVTLPQHWDRTEPDN